MNTYLIIFLFVVFLILMSSIPRNIVIRYYDYIFKDLLFDNWFNKKYFNPNYRLNKMFQIKFELKEDCADLKINRLYKGILRSAKMEKNGKIIIECFVSINPAEPYPWNYLWNNVDKVYYIIDFKCFEGINILQNKQWRKLI